MYAHASHTYKLKILAIFNYNYTLKNSKKKWIAQSVCAWLYTLENMNCLVFDKMQVNIHETDIKLVLMHELKKCYAVIIIMVNNG